MTDAKKWRPIILKDWEVLAILERRKTQLRRPINPPPPSDWAPRVGMFHPTKIRRDGEEYPGPAVFGASDESFGAACPFGSPGDRLWGRETWHQHHGGGVSGGRPCYRADKKCCDSDLVPWRSPTHMPRWASRISLEIESIRVEQLQEISVEDALAEGIEHSTLNDPRVEYRWLWESIHGPGSWEANPWVWVVAFRLLEGSSND